MALEDENPALGELVIRWPIATFHVGTPENQKKKKLRRIARGRTY
jgi:hypothetical protein